MLGIVFTLLGLIAIVIFAIQVYKAAVDTGRNPAFWTALTCVIGLALQFILPFMIGLVVALFMIIGGTAPENISINAFGLIFIVELVCFILSFVGMFLVMKHVSNFPEETPVLGQIPPPPPEF